MKKRFGRLATLAILASMASRGAHAWQSIIPGSTHKSIFNDSLAMVGSDYPDLVMFASAMRGADNSEDAHLDPTGTFTEQFWAGTEDGWAARARSEYERHEFSNAYTHLGFVFHMLQDSTHPAHVKVVYHGPLQPTYRLSPNIPFALIDSPYLLPHLDRLESYAGSHLSYGGAVI